MRTSTHPRGLLAPLYAWASVTLPLVALALVATVSHAAAAKGSKKKNCTYTVEKGDTVGGIAIGEGLSESELLSVNPKLKKNPNLLRVGQSLNICPAGSDDSSSGGKSKNKKKKARKCGSGGTIVEHTVGKSETLSRIARSYAVNESAITKYNAALKKRPDLLRVGQTIDVCVTGPSSKKSKACNYDSPVFEHSVVPGEHLGQIAGRYGVRRSDLVRLNAKLRKNPNLLSVGQKVRVCPLIAPHERDRINYTVQSGDTLGSIAKRYGLTPRELERYQRGKLADANALRSGQKLVVWVDGPIVKGFARRSDDRGVLRAGVQLPPGRHYVVKWEAGAWGTAKTVRAIQSAVARYKRKLPGGPKVHVGDISKRGGGKFSPHLSHQHGRDVDVGYVLDGKYAHETRFKSANASNLNVARSWTLIKAFIDTNEVTYIFMDYRIQKLLYQYAKKKGVSEDTLDELFQYPRGRGRTHGMIRHWRGHVNHFHVRFRK